jgi:DNA primase
MKLPEHVQKFFADRKITNKVLEDFSVGWDGHRIVYPVFDINGNKLFSNYRRDPASDIGSKYMYDKGSKVSLYGIHMAKDKKKILICEGQNDCLVAWSMGIPAVTSTGGAISFQKEWKQYFEGKKVTILLDGDEAGGLGTSKILDILPKAKVAFIPDKDGIKDISDAVSAGYDLKKIVSDAVYFKNIDQIREHATVRIANCDQTFFHDARIKALSKPVAEKKIIDPDIKDKVLRAKMKPIPELLDFVGNVAKCIFHNERTGSLHYYKSTNTVFCFGCSKHADSIAVYRQLNNCTFKEAVEALQ